MRQFLTLSMVVAGLLPLAVPLHAQVTADQLNKLSLEALTAPPSGGGAYRSSSYGHSRAAVAVRRDYYEYHHSNSAYHRHVYAPRYYRHPAFVSHNYGATVHYAAARHRFGYATMRTVAHHGYTLAPSRHALRSVRHITYVPHHGYSHHAVPHSYASAKPHTRRY